jgi:hypothetical protein
MGQLGAIIEGGFKPTTPRADPRPDQMAVEAITKPWHLITTVLCEDVANSAADNAPMIYKIFLSIGADQLPCSQRLTSVTFWLFDEPGAHHISVRVLTPDGELWVAGESEAVVDRPGTYLTTSIDFGELEFPVHGRYRVEVRLNDALAGAYPLFVQPPTESVTPGEEA